jgi:dCTP deaminase
MILSNTDILAAIDAGDVLVEPLGGRDPTDAPFNTSSLDLRLARTISVPRQNDPVSYRLDAQYSSKYIDRNSDAVVLSADRPYRLRNGRFVLGQTLECVAFPIRAGRPAYAARVEGRSSRARLGLLIHFSAPTLHCGFSGPITLEIINLGPNDIELVPDIYICQLIIEEVSSIPQDVPSQFRGQWRPSGA